MKVLVTGASGLLGTALARGLVGAGHEVRPLRRGRPGPGFSWEPASGRVDPEALAWADAIVHLAGENIAGGRWNAERKRRIRDSRVQGTRAIAEAIARAGGRVALLSASAIGYYGDRGEEVLDEASAPGEGFLAEVCREWEAATAPAAQAGARVVRGRIGIVLDPAGGALGRMAPLFRLGLGGRLGSGRQWWSWIGLPDVVGAIRHALETPALRGPLNLVAGTSTNAEFTAILAGILHRPAPFPAPAAALRLALGEMADALLLSSARVEPAALRQSGYRFAHASLAEALGAALGQGPAPAPEAA